MNKVLSVWDRGFTCEKPNSVEQRCFAGVREMLEFIGDEKIVYDDEFGVFRVPAWKAGIDAASDLMQKHCDRYGCE